MSIPISEQPPPARQAQMKEVGAGEPRGRNVTTFEACPWVGTQRDPVPYYAFPARINCCYRVEPATAIKLEHQAAYCLSSNYVRCPIYRQREVVALPERGGKRKVLKGWPRRLWGVVGMGWPRVARQTVLRLVLLLLFVAAALLLAAGWYYQGGVAARLPTETGVPATATDVPAVLVTDVVATPSATNTATVTPSTTPTSVPTATETKRPAATATDEPKPSATPAEVVVTATAALGCVPPAGWVEYVVRPGDSLFRLGQRYGATIGALQQGNCMGNVRVIYVGQRLFVPGTADFEESE